ncbi:hypothetical protein SUGI_0069460 [Cryptomeria japonica]|nr:hypothetical protein SUGI_0069460 [Cryptomeria japonica]
MEGEREKNAVTAALIMSTAFMLSIAVLTSSHFQKTNMVILQAFVILETMAMYLSLGVVTVDLLIERNWHSHTHVCGKIRRAVVLMSFGCCFAGAIVAWSFFRNSLFL